MRAEVDILKAFLVIRPGRLRTLTSEAFLPLLRRYPTSSRWQQLDFQGVAKPALMLIYLQRESMIEMHFLQSRFGNSGARLLPST